MRIYFVNVQNVLDERLKHSNSGVVLATVHLFLCLTDNVPHLHQDVYDRIKCEYNNTILHYYYYGVYLVGDWVSMPVTFFYALVSQELSDINILLVILSTSAKHHSSIASTLCDTSICGCGFSIHCLVVNVSDVVNMISVVSQTLIHHTVPYIVHCSPTADNDE